mmetsp:Transcript_87604/g.252979  ORF Transcript_87604/g.252979 Transcript_87604/m.252979 type:complete len:270 (+) Transcript_87604:61-870(+)
METVRGLAERVFGAAPSAPPPPEKAPTVAPRPKALSALERDARRRRRELDARTKEVAYLEQGLASALQNLQEVYAENVVLRERMETIVSLVEKLAHAPWMTPEMQAQLLEVLMATSPAAASHQVVAFQEGETGDEASHRLEQVSVALHRAVKQLDAGMDGDAATTVPSSSASLAGSVRCFGGGGRLTPSAGTGEHPCSAGAADAATSAFLDVTTAALEAVVDAGDDPGRGLEAPCDGTAEEPEFDRGVVQRGQAIFSELFADLSSGWFS